MSGSIVMRTGSDQLLYEGSTKHMVEEGKSGVQACSIRTARRISCQGRDDRARRQRRRTTARAHAGMSPAESTATVDDDGKTKVDGACPGNGFLHLHTDQTRTVLRFSAGACGDPGKTYTDLGDGVFRSPA